MTATEFELKKALKLFAEFKVTFLEIGDKQNVWNENKNGWGYMTNNGKINGRTINPSKGRLKKSLMY